MHSSFSERRADRREIYFHQTFDEKRLLRQLYELNQFKGKVSQKETPEHHQTLISSLEFLGEYSRQLLFFNPKHRDSQEELRLKLAIYKLLKTYNYDLDPRHLTHQDVITSLQNLRDHPRLAVTRQRHPMAASSKAARGFTAPLPLTDPVITAYQNLEKRMVNAKENLITTVAAMKIWLQALINHTAKNEPAEKEEYGSKYEKDGELNEGIWFERVQSVILKDYLTEKLEKLIVYQSWGSVEPTTVLTEILDLFHELADDFRSPKILQAQAATLARLAEDALSKEAVAHHRPGQFRPALEAKPDATPRPHLQHPLSPKM